MHIRFVNRGRLEGLQELGEEVDLLLFGFEGMGEVSYEKELKGESDFFSRVARLSGRGRVVVCGCVTDTRGHKRRSAIVAENGRLSGVSDMLHAVDGSIGCGAELRVYETRLGKMGVLVDEDLYFEEGARALVLCGCDFIVCPFAERIGELQLSLLRADAFRLGVPLLLCGGGYCGIADPKGELAFSSPEEVAACEYSPRKEYHLVERRRRGYFPKR